jgi:hypothetical protein
MCIFLPASGLQMKKVCAADGVPLYLQSSLKTTTMK